MKAVETWMPLFIGDYLADTGRLTTEQHGAYLLLIMDYWRNGPLPDDDECLAQITRLPAAHWKKQRATLSRFFRIDGGNWNHKRIDAEIAKAKSEYEKKQERAKKAAGTRWGNDAQGVQEQCASTSSSNAYAYAQALPEQCPSPSPSHSLRETALRAVPPPADKPPKRGTRFDPELAMPGEWRDWAIREGLTEPERAFERFRDFWLAKAGNGGVKLDWQATWRNWVRKDIDDAKGQRNRGASAPRHADRVGEFLAGFAAAAAQPDEPGDGRVSAAERDFDERSGDRAARIDAA